LILYFEEKRKKGKKKHTIKWVTWLPARSPRSPGRSFGEPSLYVTGFSAETACFTVIKGRSSKNELSWFCCHTWGLPVVTSLLETVQTSWFAWNDNVFFYFFVRNTSWNWWLGYRCPEGPGLIFFFFFRFRILKILRSRGLALFPALFSAIGNSNSVPLSSLTASCLYLERSSIAPRRL
jgi:hypothetical protein